MDSLRITIEQIELIRRLRLSGINKEEIIRIFDELERFEKILEKTNSPQAERSNYNAESIVNPRSSRTSLKKISENFTPIPESSINPTSFTQDLNISMERTFFSQN